VYRIAYHPVFCHPLPEGHRFPMQKYELLPEQLLYEGTISRQQLFTPEPLEDEVVCRVHDAGYLARMKAVSLTAKEIRKIGFPLSEALVERELRIAKGTVEACLFAREDSIAFNIAGGTHHAYRAAGEGFCLLNDQAIAAQWLLDRQLAANILIVDLDVHQGNGTASIFAEERRVFTFSMHGSDNYPHHKEKSDLDMALPTGMTDAAYLPLLEETLYSLQESLKPDFIFYQAGVDVLETDKLGKLKLTRAGCAQRDRLVLTMAKAAGIPVVVCMGGGYSNRISDILEAHANTYRVANEIFC